MNVLKAAKSTCSGIPNSVKEKTSVSPKGVMSFTVPSKRPQNRLFSPVMPSFRFTLSPAFTLAGTSAVTNIGDISPMSKKRLIFNASVSSPRYASAPKGPTE